MRSRCWRRRPSRGRLALRAFGERSDEVLREDSSDVRGRHLLQSRPRRHAVDLEYGGPPLRIVEDIDAGEIRADGRGRAGRAPRLILVIHSAEWRIIAATTRPRDTSRRKSWKPSRSTPMKR